MWALAVLVVLAIAGYFVVTSAAFLKGVILPRVGAAVNANITVSDATISPFHEVILQNLKVQTTGTDPLVTAPEVRLVYSLGKIIGGNIAVDEITLTSPTVTLVQNPDGTSNLDPILKALNQAPQKPSAPAQPSKPPQIDIKKIALTDGTIRQVKLYGGNHQDVVAVSHLNVNLADLKNGQTGKLTMAAEVSMDNNPPPSASAGSLSAKLDGSYSIALTPALKPGTIQGNTRFNVVRATGSLAQLSSFAANFDCNITPTEIKQIALTFQRGDTRLGKLQVAGPLDLEKTEGRLNVDLVNIDKNLLNLAGASSGVEFGPTTLNSSNVIQLSRGGNSISTVGQFNVNQFQLTRTNQTSPPLDLRANYDVNVDRTANLAVVRVLTIKGIQKGTPILDGELTSPMSLAWGNSTSNAIGDSAFNLAVTHLDLANWKAFLGDVAPSGDVNLKLQLVSKQGGKNLTFDLNSDLSNLTAGSGSNRLNQAEVTLSLHGDAIDFKKYSFPNYKFQVAQANQPLITASGSGTFDQNANSADLDLNAQMMLARVLQAFPQPGMNVSGGTAGVKVHLVQSAPAPGADHRASAPTQTVTGSFNLADFSGKVGSNTFQNFGTMADLDLTSTPDQVQIRKLNGKITQGQKVGGTFECAGTYGLSNKTAQLTAKLLNFNQDGLRPFLESALSGKTLVSISLNANSKVQYDPQGASSVTADLQVTNLVVKDPKGQIPATPLSAGARADLSLNKQVAEIKLLELALTPTARGTNVVQMTGRVDMSQTNAIQGNLKLAADSLDFTSYYDLFAGQNKAPEQSANPVAGQTTAPATAGKPEQEPEPQVFPLRNFTAEASVRRAYLHEIEIADFQMVTKVDGGHVVLNPCKLTLNGAPVSSTIDADLGVPGYKYALSFNAQAIPLAPVANTFQPDRKGQVGGTLTAQTQISGAGITGANLQKNLAGQFDIGSTNLNLAVVNIRNPLLRTLVNVVAILPDLLKNPTGGLGSLVQELTGQSKGGLADDLSKSPIDTISARGSAGQGKVALQQAVVQSAAFRSEASGTVALAPVLTNSTLEIPVAVYLSRPIAQRLNLVAANTPTNASYAKLPDFLTMKGTVGKPDPVINKLALASVALQGIGGSLSTGSKADNIVQGLQGLLGGSKSATPATNAPGQPATNQSPVGNLLNQFLKPKK